MISWWYFYYKYFILIWFILYIHISGILKMDRLSSNCRAFIAIYSLLCKQIFHWEMFFFLLIAQLCSFSPQYYAISVNSGNNLGRTNLG